MTSPSIASPRVVFFGTPEFAAVILQSLIERGVNVVGTVTTPDKPQGRGLQLRPSAVKEVALQHQLPVLTPLKHKDPNFLEALQALQGEIFCVVAYKILPKEVYTMPALGAFNIHASLLPKYRGAAPINWAIINGETETGITTFLLQEQVDTGRMLLSERVPIAPNETAGELHDELMHIGAKLAYDTIQLLAQGNAEGIEQDSTETTPAPKIFPPDCIISFDRNAEQVHNFIRGLSPFPAAVTKLPNGTKLKILRTVIAEDQQAIAAGIYNVIENNKRLIVGTATKPLEILELQREGKRAMTTEEFLRGAHDLF